jgi:hypothetical protein
VRRRGPARSSARTAPYAKPSSNIPISPKHGELGLPVDGVHEDKENAIPKPNNVSQESPANETPANESPEKEPDHPNLPSSYRDIPLDEIAGEVPVYENVSCLALKFTDYS